MKLLFLLMALSIRAQAYTCLSGTLAYYQCITCTADTPDRCGNYGALSFAAGVGYVVTSPFDGRGTWSAAADMKPASDFQAAVSGLTAYTIQFDGLYMQDLPGNTFPWGGQDGGVNYYLNVIGTPGNAYLHWVTEDGGTNNLDTAANSIQLGVTYTATLTYDGTVKRIYINNSLAASVTHSAALPATVTTFHFGAKWIPAPIFLGTYWLKGFRVMNIAGTPPFNDPTDTFTPTPTPTHTPTSTITTTSTTSPTPTDTSTRTVTATPTFTPTSTTTPTKTNSATSTNSPVASATNTPTVTVTPTRVCGDSGNFSSSGTFYAGNGTIFYKKITLSAGATIQNIYSYISSGTGQIKGAVYSDLNNYPRGLLFQSAPAYVSSGWHSVSITTGDLAAGTYWMAMECNGSVKMKYSQVGLDKFQYQQYGIWPNPALVQNILGNAALYGHECQ